MLRIKAIIDSEEFFLLEMLPLLWVMVFGEVWMVLVAQLSLQTLKSNPIVIGLNQRSEPIKISLFPNPNEGLLTLNLYKPL